MYFCLWDYKMRIESYIEGGIIVTVTNLTEFNNFNLFFRIKMFT